MESRWNVIAPQTLVVAASPYGSRDVFALALASATTAANLQPDAWLAVLDCVGYDLEHQATVEQIVGLSAVVPRLAIAHLLSQIV
jgi:hypothetical protein